MYEDDDDDDGYEWCFVEMYCSKSSLKTSEDEPKLMYRKSMWGGEPGKSIPSASIRRLRDYEIFANIKFYFQADKSLKTSLFCNLELLLIVLDTGQRQIPRQQQYMKK